MVLAENKKGVYDLIGEKQEVVINEYNRQENIYRASSTKGYRFIWILPSKDRTLAAIVSKKYLKYKSVAARINPSTKLGFIGSFESLVKLENPAHTILFLTPWWIYHPANVRQ